MGDIDIPAFGGGVAPHAGAWIEMIKDLLDVVTAIVAPHAGAWIEIYESPVLNREERRPPRGGVD